MTRRGRIQDAGGPTASWHGSIRLGCRGGSWLPREGPWWDDRIAFPLSGSQARSIPRRSRDARRLLQAHRLGLRLPMLFEIASKDRSELSGTTLGAGGGPCHLQYCGVLEFSAPSNQVRRPAG